MALLLRPALRLVPALALLGLGLVPLLTTGVACSSGDSPTPPVDAGPDVASPEDDGGVVEDPGPPAPAEWDRAVTAPTDADAQSARTTCGYKAGSLPAETQGASHPTGKAIPVNHVVVIMQENRSFDHYFSRLHEAGHLDAEVAPSDFTNPDKNGMPVAPYHDKQLCFADTAHSWSSAHKEWNGGKMDGFVLANDNTGPIPPGGTAETVSGNRAMSYYEPADLPFMYWAADQFAIGDHYHCSLLTSTWSNRMYLYAANSFGRTSNKPPDTGTALTLVDMLQMRRVTWRFYVTAAAPFAMFISQFLHYQDAHFFPIEQYYEDAKNGTLPEVAFLDSGDGDGTGFDSKQDDEHPTSNMQVGQAFLARATKALIASPLWPSSALFITYDEHGGLWDHVPPPPACPPDDTAPIGITPPVEGGFDRYGVRVPFVVISPWAKKGIVAHHTYDHTSIVRFIEDRFTLPAMSGRDANAEAPWEVFDFASPARTDKPVVPEVTIDDAKNAKCEAIFDK
jgi:phospholipase C